MSNVVSLPLFRSGLSRESASSSVVRSLPAKPSRSNASKGRWNQLSSYQTMWNADSDSVMVTYRKTLIVKAVRSIDKAGWIVTLNTDGWKTVTTKRKMNQAANQFGLGFGVFQRKGEWFVTYNGNERPFDGDSIIIETIGKA